MTVADRAMSELPRRQSGDRRRYQGTRAPPKKAPLRYWHLRTACQPRCRRRPAQSYVPLCPSSRIADHTRLPTISRLNRIECAHNTCRVPKNNRSEICSRYVHRFPVFPQAVSRVIAGQRHRYSQVSSRSHRVVHSHKVSMHIAIHKIPRVVCHWSRQRVLDSWQRYSPMKS
jgi:hypothetical protein